MAMGKRDRLDEVIPIRIPRRHKIALRRIARRAQVDVSAVVRVLIEERIALEEAAASACDGGRGSSAEDAASVESAAVSLGTNADVAA